MSRLEIIALAVLAFLAGMLSVDRGQQAEIEEATTRTVMPIDFAPDPKGGAPLAIADPFALATPCSIAPRNVPKIRKSIA